MRSLPTTTGELKLRASACDSGFSFVVLDMKWNKDGLIHLQRPASCLAQAPFSMLDKEGRL